MQVWSEGFAATGESGGAVLRGEVEAATLQEACDRLAERDPSFRAHYNRAHMTFWACRLFDNEVAARTQARQGRLTRAASPGDEVHSADQRSFIAKQAEGWEVVVEGESDSFHPTREEARVSIRAWKVKREAGTNASNLTEEAFLAICKLLSLTPSATLRRAVKARGICIVPSTSRYDLLSAGGLDID